MMKRWILPTIGVLAVVAIAAMAVGYQNADGQAAVAGVTPSCHSNAADQAGGMHKTGGDYTYTCPMHPSVERDGPGTCPECGMYLSAKTDAGVQYHCPMHPAVTSATPQKCPECGMLLEARAA